MKLYDWLKVSPYQVDDQSAADDDDDFSATKGLRILAVAYSTERLFIRLDHVTSPQEICNKNVYSFYVIALPCKNLITTSIITIIAIIIITTTTTTTTSLIICIVP